MEVGPLLTIREYYPRTLETREQVPGSLIVSGDFHVTPLGGPCNTGIGSCKF